MYRSNFKGIGMSPHEYSSQVWREHCEKVRQIEQARRRAERGTTKIGAHYVPPPSPVHPVIEVYGAGKRPSRLNQIGLGILMALAFLSLGWVL